MPDAERLLTDLAKIPADHSVLIFYGAVHRAGLDRAARRAGVAHKRQPARKGESKAQGGNDLYLEPSYRDLDLDAAFRQCMASVDHEVDRFFRKETILWIHDAPGPHDRTLQSGVRLLQFFRSIDVFNPRRQQRAHIVDTIYYGNSEDSHALQLTDVIASIIAGHLRGEPDATTLYKRIREMIHHDGDPILYVDGRSE